MNTEYPTNEPAQPDAWKRYREVEEDNDYDVTDKESRIQRMQIHALVSPSVDDLPSSEELAAARQALELLGLQASKVMTRKTVTSALKTELKQYWLAAIQDKMKSLADMGVLEEL